MDVHIPAARLAAEVVNAWLTGTLTVGWVRELLARDTLPLRHREPLDEDATEAVHRALTAFAEPAAQVFGAPDLAAAASALNEALAATDVRISVSVSEQYRPHLHFDAPGERLGDRLRANCLAAMAAVLADSAGAKRLGSCAAPGCGTVFVDLGRAGRQKFCSRRCATRAHVADHRRRTAAR